MAFLDKLADMYGGNIIAGLSFILVMSVAVLWILSYIISWLAGIFGFSVAVLNLAPAFGWLAIAGVIILVIQVAVNPRGGETWSLVAAAGILSLAIVFIFLVYPKIAPNLFDPTINQAKSVLGPAADSLRSVLGLS
jgi:hypothetical protein